MPYKNPEAKREWELEHRAERLARRRELRRMQATQEAQQAVNSPGGGNSAGAGIVLVPLLAGGALAAYSPKLALGAGGLTLLAATYYRKGWQWWLVGTITVLLALLLLKWNVGKVERKK
jgi:hypothetical protein